MPLPGDPSRPFLPLPPPVGVVTPTDLPRASASGPRPHRVLLVGAELVTSYGVASHQLGIPGTLARQIAASTGFGVDVDLLVLPTTELGYLEQALKHLPLPTSDALVLVLDAADQARRDFPGRLQRLLVGAALRMPPEARVTVAIGDPLPRLLTGRRGSRRTMGADELTSSAVAAAGAVRDTQFVTLRQRFGLTPHDAPTAYREWALSLAPAVANRLPSPGSHRSRQERLDETDRLGAVDRYVGRYQEWADSFRQIVDSARTAYGTQYAALSVIDGTTTHFLNSRSFPLPEAPRAETICNTAISFHGGFLVGDASQDERFAGLPVVKEGLVRFYAGNQVRSPDGRPVAVLCVFDPAPRDIGGSRAVTLRDFALAAERRIWAAARHEADPSDRVHPTWDPAVAMRAWSGSVKARTPRDLPRARGDLDKAAEAGSMASSSRPSRCGAVPARGRSRRRPSRCLRASTPFDGPAAFRTRSCLSEAAPSRGTRCPRTKQACRGRSPTPSAHAPAEASTSPSSSSRT